MTPCMDVLKDKIQSDGSLVKLKLRIVVKGDLQNKELVGDTWSPTASMSNLRYFLEDADKHKARVHLLEYESEVIECEKLIKFYHARLTLSYTLV